MKEGECPDRCRNTDPLDSRACYFNAISTIIMHWHMNVSLVLWFSSGKTRSRVATSWFPTRKPEQSVMAVQDNNPHRRVVKVTCFQT